MHVPKPESPEGILTEVLKNPRNWLSLPEEPESEEEGKKALNKK